MNASAQAAVRPEHTVITVAQIIEKGPGKPANIKDTDGVMFSIWHDKVASFQAGETYEIEFVRNGIFRNIKTFERVARQQPARNLSSAASPPAATSPNGNRSGEYYRPTSPRDSERMMICSLMNAFIQTGRVDCHREHLADAINELRAAYAATFGQDTN